MLCIIYYIIYTIYYFKWLWAEMVTLSQVQLNVQCIKDVSHESYGVNKACAQFSYIPIKEINDIASICRLAEQLRYALSYNFRYFRNSLNWTGAKVCTCRHFRYFRNFGGGPGISWPSSPRLPLKLRK